MRADGDAVPATEVDPRRPAAARAWVRNAAAGWPPALVEEVLLLLTEVLAADAGRPGARPGPRPVRLLAGPPTLEILLPAPVPDARAGRLAAACAAVERSALEAGPDEAGGQWLRITTRDGRAPA